MKKIELEKMETIKGSGHGQDFLAGFGCAAGLLTAGTGIGIALAVVSCSALFGDWYSIPIEPELQYAPL